jgi:hypothetical protein
MKLTMHANLITVFCGAIFLCTGCQNSTSKADNSSDGRQARLLSEQNHYQKVQIDKLTKELEQCKSERTKLEGEAKANAVQLPELKAGLSKCNEENARIKKEAEETVDFAMKEVPKAVTEENESLKAENEQLKAEIKRLSNHK